jgi:hypothetical protein
MPLDLYGRVFGTHRSKIWADNPDIPGLRKPLNIIDDGLALC